METQRSLSKPFIKEFCSVWNLSTVLTGFKQLSGMAQVQLLDVLNYVQDQCACCEINFADS